MVRLLAAFMVVACLSSTSFAANYLTGLQLRQYLEELNKQEEGRPADIKGAYSAIGYIMGVQDNNALTPFTDAD